VLIRVEEQLKVLESEGHPAQVVGGHGLRAVKYSKSCNQR
jgi:hypothetical protein